MGRILIAEERATNRTVWGGSVAAYPALAGATGTLTATRPRNTFLIGLVKMHRKRRSPLSI